MTETALLTLVDIMQVLADIQNAGLQLLRLGIQLAQVLVGKGTLEIVGILLTLFLGTEHQTDFLNTALDEFLKQDEYHRTNHTIGTGYGEEVFLQSKQGMGKKSFFKARVAGYKRVPKPATGIMALRTVCTGFNVRE